MFSRVLNTLEIPDFGRTVSLLDSDLTDRYAISCIHKRKYSILLDELHIFSKENGHICQMMNKKLLIFDFDGTLCDTRESIVKTYRMVMEHMGLEDRDDSLLASTIGTPLVKAYPELFPQLTEEEARRAVSVHRAFWDGHQDELRPRLFPGVYDTVWKLYNYGHILTIASARRRDSLKDFIRIFGLDTCFDFIVGVEDVVNAKPHPEAVNAILGKYGTDPSEAFVVGDMPVDILMGKGAGVSGCGVTYGNSCREDLLAAGASYVIDDFADLTGIPFINV